MDGYWDDYTGEFIPYDTGTDWNDWDEFEQDWADVTGGRYTLDEIASGDDVQDLYYASFDDPSILSTLGSLVSKYGTKALNSLKAAYTKPGGGTDWGKVAATAGGIYGLYKAMNPDEQRPTGYQGGIPKYEAVRERVQNTYDPSRRPGSGGQRYFSDVRYTPQDSDIAAARTAAAEEAAGLATLNLQNPAQQRLPVAAPVEPVQQLSTGGIAGLKEGKYLRGETDGMKDELRTTIENEQPAALSHGEFVIPADVVSHLGNGNSEAGAKKLYEMMDNIRHARTGTKKQGKQINPNKYLPT
jgi:hypothetical protein